MMKRADSSSGGWAAAAVAAALGVVLMASAALPSVAAEAGPVPADTARFERVLEQFRLEEERRRVKRAADPRPLGGRALVDYGGNVAASYLSLDDADARHHVLWQFDATAYARVQVDVHEAFIRARASYLDFRPGDSFDGEGDDREAVLERAWYRLNLALDGGGGGGRGGPAVARSEDVLAVQVGRQFVFWGNGLSLGAVLDGGLIDVRRGALVLQALGGMTARGQTVDFDTSRPDFDEDTRRGFLGGLAGLRFPGHQPYVYVLTQRDYNDDDSQFIFGEEVRHEYDSTYVGVGSTGALGQDLAYAVEFVYQRGRGLSDALDAAFNAVPQSREDIEAWAADVRLDYLPGGAWNPRLSAEVIVATGDEDRRHTSNTLGGNRRGTTDEAFNGLGLVNTGLAFAPAVSNLAALRLGASFAPALKEGRPAAVQFGVDGFLFGKFDDEAPIDEETASGQRYLGWEADLFVNWQVAEDVTLAVRYGAFVPSGDAFEQTDVRQFIFLGLTYAF